MTALINENIQFTDSDGLPLVGGSIYIGVRSQDPELNPITIYSDRALTTTLSNPQTLDSYGRPTNKIWVPGRYSFKVEDSAGNQIIQDLDAGATNETGIITLTNVSGTDTITAEGAEDTQTELTDKAMYIFTAANDNTGAVTLQVDSITAKSVVRNGAALSADMLSSGETALVVYNSTNDNFELIHSAAGAGGVIEDGYGDVRAGRRNICSNPSFEFWPRVTGNGPFTTGNEYTAARWRINGTGGVSVSRKTLSQSDMESSGCKYAAEMTKTASSCRFEQRYENPLRFVGKNLVFSVWAESSTQGTMTVKLRSNSNVNGQGTNSSATATVTTSLTRLEFDLGTVSFSQFATAAEYTNSASFLSLVVQTDVDTSVLVITGAQLEFGTAVTDFEFQKLDTVEADSLRYFYTIHGNKAIGTGAVNNGGTAINVPVKHPVDMRVAPTVTASGYFRANITDGDYVSYSTVTQPRTDSSMLEFNTAVGFTLTAYNAHVLDSADNDGGTGNYIEFDAEL